MKPMNIVFLHPDPAQRKALASELKSSFEAETHCFEISQDVFDHLLKEMIKS